MASPSSRTTPLSQHTSPNTLAARRPPQALPGVAPDGVPQHLAHQPLAGLAAELLEPELLDVLALRPQLGEDLEHLGARQREYHPRLLAPIPQGGVDEP